MFESGTHEASYILLVWELFQLGLVCFRLKGTDELNQKLLSNINASGKIHMVPASVNEKYVIRFCAVVQNATEEQIGACSEKKSPRVSNKCAAPFLYGFRHGRLFRVKGMETS